MILLFVFCFGRSGEAACGDKNLDGKIRWLGERVTPIRSIDPLDEDFSDLLPLVNVIGNARIVQLGENTHGDGATFLAKGRLIRFLHHVMGFDVLAWEAGFFDCRLLEAALASTLPVQEAAGQALYPLWAKSAEVMPVLEYVRKTKSTPFPMAIAGFDSRVSTPACRERLFPEFIFSIFDRLDPRILSAKDRDDFRTMSIRLVPLDYYNKPDQREFNQEVAERLVKVLDRSQDQMLAYSSPREIAFVRQALVSFLNMAKALRETDFSESEQEDADRDRYSRDAAMAENILWLYRTYYPGRKMIVWAHNYHIAEDIWYSGPSAAMAEKMRRKKFSGPHGRFLKRELGDEVFSIAFCGYQGVWGYVNEKQEVLSLPPPGSLDDLFHHTGKPVLFLGLRDLDPAHWLRRPQPGRFYFWELQRAIWPQLFDGIFFIDVMTPGTPVPDK